MDKPILNLDTLKEEKDFQDKLQDMSIEDMWKILDAVTPNDF